MIETRLILAIVLLAIGCAETQDGDVTYDEAAVREYTAALCSCSPEGRARSVCETEIYGRLLANSVSAAEAGRIAVQPEHWQPCLEQVRDCTRTSWPACEQFLRGQIREGRACQFSDECEDGLFCGDAEEIPACALNGVCIPKRPPGEPCDGDGACADDGVCAFSPDGSGGQCTERRAKGEPCPPDDFGIQDLCEVPLACVPDDEGNPVCGEPLELGEPCAIVLPEGAAMVSVNGGTFPNPCRADAFCDEETLECTPIEMADFDTTEQQQLGEECSGVGGIGDLECDYGLACVDGECAELLLNGDDCDDSEQCWAECIDGQCAPLFATCDGTDGR